MSRPEPARFDGRPDLEAAVQAACGSIAPSWPLDQQIAVNPYWGFIDRSFESAAAALRTLIGGRMTLTAEEYLGAWRRGEISESALRAALLEHGMPTSCDAAIAALQIPRTDAGGLPLLSDTIDRGPHRQRGPRWRETITQQVSQYCASHFDAHQADWHRTAGAGLFAGWRTGLQVDHAIEPLMHAPEIRARARSLPECAEAAIEWSVQRLQVPPEDLPVLLQLCLLRINGWASWCAYLAWQGGFSGTPDPHLRELLAIRLAWEALLDDGRRAPDATWPRWREDWNRARAARPSAPEALDPVWQRAHEITYQERLIGQLEAALDAAAPRAAASPPAAQLVFCIDVRSERFRRALEASDPCLETRGFAGFFGLPIRYAPIGASFTRPQLPGLIAPTLEATQSTGDEERDRSVARRRRRRLGSQAAFVPFLRLPSGAFTLVETLGLGYLGAILQSRLGSDPRPVEALGLGSDGRNLRPVLTGGGARGSAAPTELVESILRAMSLTRGFARLLVLVGHGSQSVNNPHAAALDCGACGGHTGEVNARLLAGLLNDVSVRAELARRGIEIPDTTVAVAALHNTTTDEVHLFDADAVPASHARDLSALRRAFAAAGTRTRAERAPSLGLGALAADDAKLLKAVRRRARDWSQTRPEWGLAGNAAFIVAPRSRTRGLDLGGRVFLHDYEWADDADGKVIELIMTAPMVVAHWINLQYLASTVDPLRFGAGNKVLHNVACGRIGVFEGNSGDLRIGLPRQSVHDGERRMHDPLRLTVVIEAPRPMIERVLERHPTPRRLVDHEWLHLFRLDERGVERYRNGRWQEAVTGAGGTTA